MKSLWVKSFLTSVLLVISFSYFYFSDHKSAEPTLDSEIVEEVVLDNNMDWDSINIESLQYLEQLLKIPSVRKDEHKVVAYIQKILEQENIPSKIIPHPNNPSKVSILAELLPAEDSLAEEDTGVILLNHSDVVEVNLNEWEVDPFSGLVKDGQIYGRGALDMKSMLVMQLVAFIQIHKLGVPLQNKIMFLSVPDEESGGEYGAKYLLESHPHFFNGYKYVLNEGSFGIKNFPFQNNIVVPIQVAEKGILGLEILAQSESGHGSMPSQNYSSLQLMRFLLELQAHQKFILTPVVEIFFNNLSQFFSFPKNILFSNIQNPLVQKLVKKQIMSNKTLNAMVTNTISVTGLNVPNFGPNVIPSETQAYLDVRVLPDQSVEALENEILNLAKKYNVTLKKVEYTESSSSSIDSNFYNLFSSILQDNIPEAVITPYLSPGATDSRFFRDRGFECYGLVPILIEMEDLSKMHGKNESISIENLKLGTKIIFETLSAYNQISE